MPIASEISATTARDLVQLALQRAAGRAGSAARARRCGRAGSPSRSRSPPPPPRPAVDVGAGEDLPRPARTGHDSPVSVELSTRSSSPRASVGVGGDPVAGGEQDHIAGNDLLAVDLGHLAVAPHPHALRQHLPQRLDRLLGPVLLDVGEDRVDEDHGDDRRAQLRQAGEQREHRAGPEQEREQMDEVGEEARSREGPRASSIALGPTSASRRRACAVVSPSVVGRPRQVTVGAPRRASIGRSRTGRCGFAAQSLGC